MSDSIKMLGLLHRRKGFTLEQFSDHWLRVHGELAFRIKWFYRYVQNHRIDDPIPGFMPPADGIPCNWITGPEAAASLLSDPDYLEGAFLDEANFMERGAEGGIVVEQFMIGEQVTFKRHELVPKAIFTFKRRTDLTPEAFGAAWCAIQRPWFCPVDGVVRFVRCPMLPDVYSSGEPAFDVMEELWWINEESYRHSANEPRCREMSSLCSEDGIRGMRVREERRRWDE